MRHILLVEDDVGHVELIKRAFASQTGRTRLTVTRSLSEARASLTTGPPDLVIIDLKLPDGRGLDLLPGDGAAAAYPVVVMTSHGNEQLAVEAMKAGTVDYVVKSEANLADLPGIAEKALRTWEHITERKRAEEAVQRSEERYRALVEGSVQGIAIVLYDGTRVYANQALLTLFGYETVEAYLAQPALDNVAPQDRDRMRIYLEDLLQGAPASSRCEYQALRTDGTPLWLECIMTPITWEDQPALLETLLDITERKQAEAERLKLEAQLRQAQKMEAIGTLAGGIAHEFNNILSAILGYTDLTQYEVQQGSFAWTNLQEVLKAGRRAKDLVQQILAFSRQSDHGREPLSVALVVHEALGLLRASLPATIEIRSRLTDEDDTILGSRAQLHQVVMNLCVNAEQAMRQTGGVLEIEVDRLEVAPSFAAQHPPLDPGPHVRLRVQDTGPGIAPEALEHVFEPFFTTKGVGEGTGMGLAIVHGIVTNHGGVITVESTPGTRTIFTVYLPQSGATLPQDPSPLDDELPRGNARILFVDDEEMLARLGRELLARLGYEVVSSTSGREALDVFRADPHRFDLVIADQTMPQMTGEALGQELRRIRPDIPIIICTGFSHLMNAEKAQASGFDAFLMKPLMAQDLAATIERVLGHAAREPDEAQREQ